MPNLCIVTTVSASVKAFYQGQIEALQQSGFDVTVVCADARDLCDTLPDGTRLFSIPLTRTTSPGRDLKSLWLLYRLFRHQKFDIVQYSTPKASMLGSLAAYAARVPIGIYILWGLYYTGRTGIKRFLLKMIEKLICSLSTHVVPISREMVVFAEKEGLVRHDKCEVMLNGSACGVDLELFEPGRWLDAGRSVRDALGIPHDSIVIGTVARLTGDKGVNELVAAFDSLSNEISGIYLLLVGEQEQKDRLLATTEETIERNIHILVTGWQSSPLPYYAAMDIFCLPTYREGFGEVNLEAQAMGLPVVSTDVIGPRESVETCATGFLVEPKSVEALIAPLQILIKDAELRKKMGSAGRLRVERMFDRKDIIRAVVEHRLKLISELRRK